MPARDPTERRTLDVEGMSCSHCSQRVEDALVTLDGVRAVDVSLEQGQATVETTDAVDPAGLLEAVRQAGYEASHA